MDNNLKTIQKLMKEHGRSFYIYDEKTINRQADILLENFPDFEFLYSIKTNPFPPIVKFLSSKGFGGDAASAKEVDIGYRAGLAYEKILYSTPGKTRRDIEDTMEKSIIIADSYNELALINDIAAEKGVKLKVGLRINMNFNMDGGKGTSSKFGVDQDSLLSHKDFINNLSNIKISGIHVHLRSQVLDYKKLYNYYDKIFSLAVFCIERLDWAMDFINFGGGLGIVYSEKYDDPLDIEELKRGCKELVNKFKIDLRTRLIIETGRFLVCEGGNYITYIVDIKESMGKKYLIVEKGLNGFLRPSIAEMLKAYLPEEKDLKPSEPLFTTKDAFEFLIPEGDKTIYEEVTIAGSLCTAADVMAVDIKLPKAKIGDILIVTKAGSYAYSLSPVLFASHSKPMEFYIGEKEII